MFFACFWAYFYPTDCVVIVHFRFALFYPNTIQKQWLYFWSETRQIVNILFTIPTLNCDHVIVIMCKTKANRAPRSAYVIL